MNNLKEHDGERARDQAPGRLERRDAADAEQLVMCARFERSTMA